MTSDATPNVELRLRAAVESAPSGLLMTDRAGRIVLVNREIERLFGYSREELLGQPVEMLVPEGLRRPHHGFRQGFLSDPSIRPMGAGRDLFGRRKDGSEVPVEIGLTPVATDEGIFVLSSIVDITARKRSEDERRVLEEKLQQAQKMEAIGTLAGGIAHDFNNILGAILGYGELLQRSVSEEQARGDLAEIIRAGQRGRQLVERILAFSRRTRLDRQPLALGSAVREALQLLRPTLPASVELDIRVPDDTPRVLADPTSLHQVVSNILSNAAQAMPGGGTLEVSVGPLYVRDSMARARPDLHEGPYGVLSIQDSGAGMDRSVRERAFEPFFSTKLPGSGTGLGLAIVHNIMRDHDGAIELDSEPGRGTLVRCLFPALTTSSADWDTVAEAGLPLGNGECIVLVEDDRSLLAMNERRLLELGYRPMARQRPRDALALVGDSGVQVELLITDYSMPGMNGVELAREAKGARPALPVLLMSGLMEELPSEVLAEVGVGHVVRKPVSLVELATAVHRSLRPAAAGGRAVTAEGDSQTEGPEAG